MTTFCHTVVFESSTIAIKTLRSWNRRDLEGFDHEYGASRISLVRAGVFARVIEGRQLVADPTQALLVNRGDVHRFTYPLDGGNACTVLEPALPTLAELCNREGEA